MPGFGVEINIDWPLIVECRESGLLIHHDRVEVPGHWIGSSIQWKNLINRCSRPNAQEYIVLLVRTDGIENFKMAEKMLKDRDCRYGYDILMKDQGELQVRYQVE